METRISRLLVFVISLSLWGCATTQDTERGAEQWVPSRAVSNVRLGEKAFAAVDFTGEERLENNTVATGEMARRVFTGSSTADWEIELLGSSLTGTTRDHFPLPVWVTTINYAGTFLLKGPEGKEYTINAVGVATETKHSTARIAAVQNGLDDLATKVAALIDSR